MFCFHFAEIKRHNRFVFKRKIVCVKFQSSAFEDILQIQAKNSVTMPQLLRLKRNKFNFLSN